LPKVIEAVMAIISKEGSWLASAQQKVSQQVGNLVSANSTNATTWFQPVDVDVSRQLGDFQNETRQWSAFEYADLMEQGLAGGVASNFMEVPARGVRLCVEQRPEENELLLSTRDGKHLLVARRSGNGEGFSIFVMGEGGESPRALGPAFSLTPNSAKDNWTLQAITCDKCECRGRRVCGSRQLAHISMHVEEIGEAQICCLDMEIPAVDQDKIAEIWCPMCNGQDAEQHCLELTTRKPKWNGTTLALDFFGRCSMASARNFQLGQVGKPEKLKLLFGMVGEHSYVLEYMRPLSMVQAFAAAISMTVWT
jgi:hypothetical protein